MQFVDRALARRLESAEEMPQVDCARMYQKMRPEIGAAFEPICGGHMIFAGLDSPIGHACGLGLDGPVTAAELDRLDAAGDSELRELILQSFEMVSAKVPKKKNTRKHTTPKKRGAAKVVSPTRRSKRKRR